MRDDIRATVRGDVALCYEKGDAPRVRMPAAAERIRRKMASASHDLIEVGRDLIEQKERLGHGNFGPWIEAEFGMSEYTARRMMNVAESLGLKSGIVPDLPPTILYQLAAPSTLEHVRRTLSWRPGAARASNQRSGRF